MSGLAIGGITGSIGGLQYADKNNLNAWTGQEKGSYSVYQGSEGGTTKYVGITKRDPQSRFDEHNNSGTERARLKYEVTKRGLTKTQARIMEQNLINKHGLPNLHNKINSITPRHWDKFGIKK